MGRYWNTVTQGQHLSKDEWLTPPAMIQKLGPFDLDPCAPVARPWDTASKYYTESENGLAQDWAGFVWMNPPYGKGLSNWVEKLAQHGNGIGLIPLRSTDAKWFHKNVWGSATAVLFYRGRIKFWNQDGTEAGSCPHASLLIAYGDKAATRLQHSDLPGKFITLY